MLRLRLIVLIIAAAAAAASARADQTDKRLDALFGQLAAAKDARQGGSLAGKIWQIWLETQNGDAKALLAEGIEEMDGEDYNAALRDFDKLVVLAPTFAEAWNRRATLLYLMDDLDGSVRDIERTLELEPRHFGALSGLGLIYMQLGKDEAALKAFKRALEINPYLSGAKQHIEALEKRLRNRAI